MTEVYLTRSTVQPLNIDLTVEVPEEIRKESRICGPCRRDTFLRRATLALSQAVVFRRPYLSFLTPSSCTRPSTTFSAAHRVHSEPGISGASYLPQLRTPPPAPP